MQNGGRAMTLEQAIEYALAEETTFGLSDESGSTRSGDLRVLDDLVHSSIGATKML